MLKSIMARGVGRKGLLQPGGTFTIGRTRPVTSARVLRVRHKGFFSGREE